MQRRGISSTRVISTDENSGPRMDQSGLLAGKSNIQTRRSVLGALNTNTTANNEVIEIIEAVYSLNFLS